MPSPFRTSTGCSTRTDARLASIIAQGVAERLYLISAETPRIVDESSHVANPAREPYVPITSHIQTDLAFLVRRELRPVPAASAAPAGAQETRLELRESIGHRPERRAGPPRGSLPR